MQLQNDHAYCLCLISRLHSVPLDITIESEQILASELTKFYIHAYNHVFKKVNVEVLTIAVLQLVCVRHNLVINFDDFVKRMSISQIHVDKTCKRMSKTYKDGRMPRMIDASTVCSTILCA